VDWLRKHRFDVDNGQAPAHAHLREGFGSEIVDWSVPRWAGKQMLRNEGHVVSRG